MFRKQKKTFSPTNKQQQQTPLHKLRNFTTIMHLNLFINTFTFLRARASPNPIRSITCAGCIFNAQGNLIYRFVFFFQLTPRALWWRNPLTSKGGGEAPPPRPHCLQSLCAKLSRSVGERGRRGAFKWTSNLSREVARRERDTCPDFYRPGKHKIMASRWLCSPQ